MINLEFIINISNDFITVINRNYVYEFANKAYCSAINKNRNEIINKKVSDIWGEERFNLFIKKSLDECFSGKEVHCIDRFKFGEVEKYIHVAYYPFYENNEVTHVVVFSHDITKIQELESKLLDYEFRDPITGLFNRKSLDMVLDMEIDKAKRSKNKMLAVLLINLVNLSKINQLYGTEIGDILLENSGLRIKNLLRNSDYVFRFVGKEFTAILTDINNNYDISRITERIYHSITIPYHHKFNEIFLECNIGVSLFPVDGTTKEDLLSNAMNALELCKKNNEKILFYNKNLHHKIKTNLEIELGIKKALQNNEFFLLYQPIVDSEGKIIGCESLIRWLHPDRGIISPMEFIPVAEENGLIIDIGKWVLFYICQNIAKWGPKYNIYTSINLSAKEFENKEIVEIIKNAVKNNNIDTKYLKIEITETVSMRHQEDNIRKIIDLKNMGIDTFIDDFGTGYSSLSYLKKLPVNTFKLDKSFIDNIISSKDEIDFVSGIISIIKSRNKELIVEGVATYEQYEILRNILCEKMQGYYFSKPVSENELELYLENGGILPLKIL